MTTKNGNNSAMPKNRLSLRLALGLAAPIALLTAGIGYAATVFSSGFESGFTGWGKELCCSHSGVISSSPVREGSRSVKFTLNKTDPDVAGSKRAEVRLGTVAANSEYTYRFSTFLPSSFTPDPSSDIVTQWHSYPDFNLGETWQGGPPLFLMTVNGTWRLMRIWDSKPVTTPFRPQGTESISLGSYQTNTWTDWVVHVKWSYQSNGIVEVWKNGQLVVRKYGPNTYNDRVGPYMKMGIYKTDWKANPQRSTTTQRIAYFDAVRVDQGNTGLAVSSTAKPQSLKGGSTTGARRLKGDKTVTPHRSVSRQNKLVHKNGANKPQ
jgi:hypothetical protein